MKKLAVSFLGFALINLTLYGFIAVFHPVLNFNNNNFQINAHHFFEVPRSDNSNFDLIKSLAPFDGQWYLKIAESGYPKYSDKMDYSNRQVYNSLAFAFFPAFPATLGLFNLIFKNTHLAAFILVNLLMAANFFSLFYVVRNLFSQNLAFKTVYLTFLFPFAIFYRSYFSEGLYLLILLWFSYFFIKKSYFISGILLSILNITRGAGLLLNLVFVFFLYRDVKNHKISLKVFLASNLIAVLPLTGWVYFTFLKTGDPVYFFTVQKSWLAANGITFPLLSNIKQILDFFNLPLHLFHYSQIDIMVALISLTLLFFSKKFLGIKLWLISLVLLATPLLVKDFMSYSRMVIVVFPLFIYLASILKGASYYIVLTLFGVGLLLTSLYFVNWHWVG